jgi:hypothetical protein
MMNGEAKMNLIRERLAKILATDGTLSPDAVLKDARNPKSPLHDEFEWDDSAAAHQYRVDQARALIARVKVEIVTTERVIRVPAYVRDPNAAHDEQGYVSTVGLKDDRARSLDVLRNEAERTAAHLQRTRDLAAALGLEAELEPLLDGFTAFRLRLVA